MIYSKSDITVCAFAHIANREENRYVTFLQKFVEVICGGVFRSKNNIESLPEGLRLRKINYLFEVASANANENGWDQLLQRCQLEDGNDHCSRIVYFLILAGQRVQTLQLRFDSYNFNFPRLFFQ
jgi:hypothetical protein